MSDSRRVERSRDRGASLVEYAMVMALVVVALIGAIDHMTDGARDEISTRGETAAANGEAIGDLSVGSSPTTPTSSPPTSAPAADVTAASVSPIEVTTTSAGVGHRWNMSVRITVVDSTTGGPLSGAVVTGSFEGDTRSCTTDATGSCPLTRERIHSGVDTMSFTLASVTYQNPSGAPAPAITFPPETTVFGTKP